MSSAAQDAPRPHTSGDYGQVLVRHLFVRYRWTLIFGALIGGAIAMIVSMFLPPSYSASATVIVDKGGGGGMSGLLGGLPFLGGGNSALESEIQVIKSREIGRSVIDELGLQVEVVDWKSPDMSINRMLGLLRLGPRHDATREEIYRRLRIRDVAVSPEVLKDRKLDLRITGTGWRCKGQEGASGEPVVFDNYSFTPVIGSAARPGDSFRLVVRSNFDAVHEFSKNLGAATVDDVANVVTVSYHHRNPFLCREVVDLVVSKYLDRYEQQELGDYDVILDYIDAEIETADNRVREIAEELDQYREENELYQPTAQAAAAINSMAELSITRSQNDIQLRQIENLLSNMNNRSEEEINHSIQSPVNPLPIDQVLTDRLASMVSSLESLRLTHTEAHPEVIRVKSVIETILGQIEDSLKASAKQLRLANSRLSTDISGFRSQLTNLPAAESKIALLNSELQVNGEILAMLKKSEAETRLIREETTTDVRLLDSAIVANKPSSPRLGKNLFLGVLAGFVLAIFLGISLEAGTPGVNSLREFRALASLPILGVLQGERVQGRWKPGALTDRAGLEQAGRRIRHSGRLVGLVHLSGSRGGYDLAWGLSGLSGEMQPVLLIDADFADQGFSRAVSAPETAGLAELSSSIEPGDETLVDLDNGRWLLTPGSGRFEPAGGISALRALASDYHSALVLLPHPSGWGSLGILPAALDELVLVAPQLDCSREELEGALATLEHMGVRASGIVVTNYTKTRDSMWRSELKLAGLE